ncbi:lipoma-preferred partner homolog [Watersipora subatra]|uniref:lipoma-preferred partner homolog n=1 Tax=Watersipora subatra TaxID=2589382 RepID=UPI00355BCB4B
MEPKSPTRIPPPVAPKPAAKLIALRSSQSEDIQPPLQTKCSTIVNVGQLQQPHANQVRLQQSPTSPPHSQLPFANQSQLSEPPFKQPAKTSSKKELADLTSQLLLNMEKVSSEPEFAGVCSRCHVIIRSSEEGCTAMDKFYHSACFTCETCSRTLSGHSFYSLESRILCEGCYVNTLEKCIECKLPVTERILRATGKVYHPECFTCIHCNKSLDGVPFTVDAHNKIHCVDDFHMKYAPRCSVCREAILPAANGVETVRVVALDRNFHVNCYKCEDCGVIMSTESPEKGCFPMDGQLLCKLCNASKATRGSSMSSDM